MNRTPHPGPTGGPTEQHPERHKQHPERHGPRTGFFAAVGCGSLVLALIIGVGGYVGVGALTGAGGPDPGGTTTSGEGSSSGEQSSADEDGTAADGEQPVRPVGSDEAEPAGTAVPYTGDEIEGHLELAVGEVTWNATETIAEANHYNPVPEEGMKYILIPLEASYRGSGTFDAHIWSQRTFVDAGGDEYTEQYVVTPNYVGEHGEISDGESFTQELVFAVPDDAADGGHIVISPFTGVDDGTWVEVA